MSIQLMQHQKEALDFLATKKSAALHLEMGLGKTLIMLEHMQRMDKFPALIVCPLSVVSVWAQEAKKFGHKFSFSVLTGTFMERLEKLNTPADVYVINYEGLRILRHQLKAKNFKMAIVDESHRIKNNRATQTKIILELGDVIPFKYELTGTPITKSPEDLWAQMEFISPQLLGNFWNFRAKHINFKPINIHVPGGTRLIRKPISFKNLKELEKKIHPVAFRRTKAECLRDLPDKIYKSIPIFLSKEQNKKYFELKNSLATVLDESGQNKLNIHHAATLLQKLRQVCQGFLYDEYGGTYHFEENAKLNVLKDLLEDIPDEKVIIFTWFKAELDIIRKALAKDYEVLVYGGSSEERSEIAEKFQTSDKPVIFLSQIETAKEGITLTAANHVIYFSNSWSYSTRKQSEDRDHRKGQDKNVIYYDFVAQNTVDELVYDSLILKADVADKITGDSARLAKLVLNQ